MTIQDAATLYQQRQARLAHPAGTFDGAGRWYPSESEQQPCCRAVRSPSRNWPYSLMLHCRTAVHVARLCGVDARELRRAARAG